MTVDASRYWSDYEDDLLRRYWLAGYSASRISQVLRGRSRGSIVSRIHRLRVVRPDIPDRSTKKRERPPSVRMYDDASRLARLAAQREQWEALRITSRDPCVFCGVREDQHEALGCRSYCQSRAA